MSHRGRVETKTGRYRCRPHGPDGDGDLSMDEILESAAAAAEESSVKQEETEE
jgi:hypothetical protein